MGGGRGRGRFPDPSSRSLAYVVCYLSFRLSVHLSVRPCFCLCACSPVVGRTACFLRLRPSGSPPSSPSIKPSVCRAPGARTRGAALSRRGVPRPGRAHLPRRSPLRAFRLVMSRHLRCPSGGTLPPGSLREVPQVASRYLSPPRVHPTLAFDLRTYGLTRFTSPCLRGPSWVL